MKLIWDQVKSMRGGGGGDLNELAWFMGSQSSPPPQRRNIEFYLFFIEKWLNITQIFTCKSKYTKYNNNLKL